MTNTREKLIKLLCDVIETDGCSGHCNFPPCYLVKACADNLIANGVTVQEWISVKDRLPEAYKLVLAVCKSGKIFVGEYVDLGWRTLWRIKTARDSTKEITQIVTHWMPLPEQPKGE